MLTIAHNAVAASNRARFDALAARPSIDATLLTPPWWFEEGQRIAAQGSSTWRVGRALFAGNGTRHVYRSGLVRAVRQIRPDVIDLFEEPFSLVALQTLLVRDAFAPQAALVFYSAVNVRRNWRPPYRWIERLLFRRADGAHAPNTDVPAILRSKGMTRQPIAVIPLGVDVDRFARAEPMPLEHIPRPRIGFVGRLEPVKGLDILVDAFGRLEPAGSLVIAGDGSELPRLRQATVRDSRMHILPPVSYETMPALLKAFDVLVLPSVTILPMHREQFGRVLAEAMSAGVPLIGSSSGAIPEVIGDAGLVVPERDAAQLAHAIDAVLRDGDLRQKLIERGQHRARTRFAWTTIAEQTVDLFRAARAYRHGVPDLQVVGA